jgi:hypothetical protein
MGYRSDDTTFCVRNRNFLPWQRNLIKNSPDFYLQYLQDENVELLANHQAIRVTSRLPRSGDSSGTIPSLDSRDTFFTHSASIFESNQIDWDYSIEFPSVVKTDNAIQKQSRSNSPSVTSGITGMLLSTSAQGGPSYASVTAQQTPDPDMIELKEQLAELKTTIQAQQQQLQHTSASQAPKPSGTSLPPDFATTMMAAISSLQAEIAELRNLYQPFSASFPARKKVCPIAQTSAHYQRTCTHDPT